MSKEPIKSSSGKTALERRWPRPGGFKSPQRMPASFPLGEPDIADALHAADTPSVSPARDEGDALMRSAAERFEQHMAEINRASAMLRHALPDLEAWPNPSIAAAPVAKARPVWLMISVVWISTLALTAAATLAIAVLVS
jgi:hypothetical protein